MEPEFKTGDFQTGDRVQVTEHTESFYGTPIPQGVTGTVMTVYQTGQKLGWILLRLHTPVEAWTQLSLPRKHLRHDPDISDDQIQTAVQSIATSIARIRSTP